MSTKYIFTLTLLIFKYTVSFSQPEHFLLLNGREVDSFYTTLIRYKDSTVKAEFYFNRFTIGKNAEGRRLLKLVFEVRKNMCSYTSSHFYIEGGKIDSSIHVITKCYINEEDEFKKYKIGGFKEKYFFQMGENKYLLKKPLKEDLSYSEYFNSNIPHQYMIFLRIPSIDTPYNVTHIYKTQMFTKNEIDLLLKNK